jgi:uncharacterized protein
MKLFHLQPRKPERNAFVHPNNREVLRRIAYWKRSLAAVRQAARSIYPGANRFHRWRRVRFLLRSVLWWRTTVRWLECCSAPPLSNLVERQPVALERVHRPFLHGCLSARDRLAVSLDHSTITQQRAPRVSNQIACEGRVQIATLMAKDERWIVSLETCAQFQREGDWSLCIRDVSGRRIVSCTFSLAFIGGKLRHPRMCIGAIQGPDRCMDGRALFRTLTKKWSGLRPKAFAIYLAQHVAHTLGVNSTFIVSNHSHVYSSWQYRLRKRRVSADYDNLARECGAFGRWNGWSLLAPLPCPLREQVNEETSKLVRRKRDVLRDDVVAQIRERLRA